MHVSTANVSVLRWWFEDKSSRLVVNDSLSVQLALAADQRFWEIRLSGINASLLQFFQNIVFYLTFFVTYILYFSSQ